MKKIAAFHLYNDFSGSPRALKTVLEGLLDKGCHVDLITSEGGVLDELTGHQGLVRRTCGYSFSVHRFVTAFRFLWAQIKMFCLALRYIPDRDVVFYINTIMPLGAALAGRMTGKKVVYHYHEDAHAKGGIYPFLCRMMQTLADNVICVSSYQGSHLARKNDVHVVPNALNRDFIKKLNPDPEAAFDRKSVLMLSSLKEYKGIAEYFHLAEMNPQLSFVIVINDTQDNIGSFLKTNNITGTDNIKWYPRQSDVTVFYNAASVVLNLSKKDHFVETFGLTALEAMTAGLPVIVPTVGGISELVEDGVNGYKADAENLEEISALLGRMLSVRELYNRLCASALVASGRFSSEAAVSKIETVLFKND